MNTHEHLLDDLQRAIWGREVDAVNLADRVLKGGAMDSFSERAVRKAGRRAIQLAQRRVIGVARRSYDRRLPR